MIRVLMIPFLSNFDNDESGIKRVIESYRRYSSQTGIEYVECGVDDVDHYDVFAVHAGSTDSYPKNKPFVALIHGVYWTADYQSQPFELKANAHVVESMRRATEITVPSAWTAETIARDLRVMPHIINHGIEWEEWQHTYENQGYVLWNKNRVLDVCDPTPVGELAKRYTGMKFVSTFAPYEGDFPSIKVIGLLPHDQMKKIIQQAGVYLSTTKETFGIGTLEAMAAGVPVLGFAHGGNLETVEHGVTGYLARPGDYDDLAHGLEYCIRHREVLSKNASLVVRQWNWENAAVKIAKVYKLALEKWEDGNRPLEGKPEAKPIVTVVIPTFNYADKVSGAIQSVQEQTVSNFECFVVDDGSTDDTKNAVMSAIRGDERFHYIYQPNAGVAEARNNGVSHGTGKYICTLDADDRIDPEFLEACVKGLEGDPAISIAYTGLFYTKPDGTSGLSPWPGESDYDKQLEGLNQIPTCNVMRRIAWERLGGQRQRYAPQGAGEEDAEMWLRAGAYGFRAKKVTTAGLFLYSWMSGRVSGDKQHRMVDYRLWHPWTKDKQHPIASIATPLRFSHLARQYDQPVISVIIPVGPGHEKVLISALDSLEAQSFRKWEVVVVWDNDTDPSPIMSVYPYIRLVKLEGNNAHGAGVARNRGVDSARAPLVLFLDADDWLVPEALTILFSAWEQGNAIIYSDYVGKAIIDISLKKKLEAAKRLLDYDEKSGLSAIDYKSLDYDCERAQRQPDVDMYIWNLVTTLLPKEWHYEIGGFDEKMKSWEDWDYYIRMARAGKCFARIPERLVVYRFYSGNRRETGLHEYDDLIKYMREKNKGAPMKPCTGCGGSRGVNMSMPNIQKTPTANQGNFGAISQMSDDDFVLCLYAHPNTGQHRVIGTITRIDYKYHGGGEEFLVHRRDISAQPDIFQVINQKSPTATEVVIPMMIDAPRLSETIPPPIDISDSSDDVTPVRLANFSECSDIKPAIQKMLGRMEIDTWEKLASLSENDLTGMRGVGIKKARAIREYARSRI